jgi:hypothetical protein
MANDVVTTIRVIGSEEATDEFRFWFTAFHDNQEGVECMEFMPPWDEEDYPSKEWMKDCVGSDNTLVTYVSTGNVDSAITYIRSTWSHVVPFAGLLGHHLRNFDENVRLEVTYVDEMMNFAGSGNWHKGKWSLTEKDAFFWSDFSEEEIDHLLEVWLVRKKVCL